MFRAQKSSQDPLPKEHDSAGTWQPSASIAILKIRATIYQQIREFFLKRQVLEVETPLLCRTSVTDPYINSIPANYQNGQDGEVLHLQTSPEYAMKRLLAAGSGCIFQLGKAFRQGEVGKLHNPEFSMLEWYRLNFNHHDLMQEVDALLQLILNTKPADKISYENLFAHFLNLNLKTCDLTGIQACADKFNLNLSSSIEDIDTGLQLLLTHLIEPQLGQEKPIFIYDFPASQAALARLTKDNHAARFEVYYKGIELANGFHELIDADEQRKRFEKNNIQRKKLGLARMQLDENFLHALQHGLPDCAGVALGLDRLIMLACNETYIANVLSFDFTRV